MELFRFASAACLAASFAFAAPAGAAPYAGQGPLELSSGESLVVPVRGCHRNVRRHYVPQVGRTIRHFHRGRNCRPIRAERPGRRDCHRNVRRHYLPRYGGSVLHRHVGPNCRTRVFRRYDRGGDGFCVRIGPIRYCED